jgi:hypothetical protein
MLRAALLALALAAPAAAEVSFSGNAAIAVARLSSAEVALETRLTNILTTPICVTAIATRAYFSDGARADLAFSGLDGLTQVEDALRVEPGQSFGARLVATLLGYEAIYARVEAESGAEAATTAVAQIRRHAGDGAYYFELSYTYRHCADTGGPNPLVTMTLGRSEVVRLR